MVSPLYVAIHGRQSKSVKMLLKEGYSPDAQDCTQSLGLHHSPLSFALSVTSGLRVSESVSLLIAAGATLSEDVWLHALATDATELLQLILEHRWIASPETLTQDCSVSHHCGKTLLKLQELRELLCVALNIVRFAACWLPLLLKAGLEPSLLLQPRMLEQADGEVLNYLLEFVNWSTLSPALKLVLDRRRVEKSWKPCPDFDSIPSLSHLCRLQVRSLLGPDRLMRTSAIQQLPVPSPLHDFLQFRDIPEVSYIHTPSSLPSDLIQEYWNTHQHIHVL